MPLDLTPEQRDIGKENFQAAIGSEFTRRKFLMGTLAAGAVTGAGLGAMYFNYGKSVENPLRVGVIGTGDEGSVLIGALNPNYVQVTAIADIRPYNVWRAFNGDWSSDRALKLRTGLMRKYDWKSEDEAKKNVKVYGDYNELLKDPRVEAVIIALPLHLHAEASIKAMRAGKHVLTEKLMGHSIAECKEMARVSRETGKLLATGHQRHYSVLYDNALELIRANLIGNVHFIRAQWHRQVDTWSPPLPGSKKLEETLKTQEEKLASAKGKDIELWQKRVEQTKQQLREEVEAANYGYVAKSLTSPSGYERSALEELVRWRLWDRTGAGLMAELGSHQLDAASLCISATYPKDAEGHSVKVQPLTVYATGGKHLYDKEPRDCEDHVYCTFEFPGPEYFKPGTREIANPNKKIVVTYSSINGSGFGNYGEVVMGDKGTLVLEKEEDVLLYPGSGTDTKVGVKGNDKGAPVIDTTSSGGAAAAVGKLAVPTGADVSKGYTEEIEHWAWCIRNFDEAAFKANPDHYVNLPRCHPKVAMGDAIIALTSNMAVRKLGGAKVEFKPEWFDIDSDETPEGDKPDLTQARYKV